MAVTFLGSYSRGRSLRGPWYSRSVSYTHLEQLARDINFYNNNNYAMSEDIHRAADEMLHIINRMSEA